MNVKYKINDIGSKLLPISLFIERRFKKLKIKNKKENNRFTIIIDDIVDIMKYIRWKEFILVSIFSLLIANIMFGVDHNIFKTISLLLPISFSGTILTYFIDKFLKHPMSKLSFIFLTISMESYFMSILVNYACIDYPNLNTFKIILEKVFTFVFQIGYLLFAIILINRIIIVILNKIFK